MRKKLVLTLSMLGICFLISGKAKAAQTAEEYSTQTIAEQQEINQNNDVKIMSQSKVSDPSTDTTQIESLDEQIKSNDELLSEMKNNQKKLNESYKARIKEIKKSKSSAITAETLNTVKENIKTIEQDNKTLKSGNDKLKKAKRSLKSYKRKSDTENIKKEQENIIEIQKELLEIAGQINNNFKTTIDLLG